MVRFFCLNSDDQQDKLCKKLTQSSPCTRWHHIHLTLDLYLRTCCLSCNLSILLHWLMSTLLGSMTLGASMQEDRSIRLGSQCTSLILLGRKFLESNRILGMCSGLGSKILYLDKFIWEVPAGHRVHISFPSTSLR